MNERVDVRMNKLMHDLSQYNGEVVDLAIREVGWIPGKNREYFSSPQHPGRPRSLFTKLFNRYQSCFIFFWWRLGRELVEHVLVE
jgi:hypothetical protein